ncbi:hypothetical protein BLNAU_17910 [Blattamonas nauphoetae]|uniref:Uncharacterized protein n=1 Tax=Blattamonas nauphoetae TaxID=2049346 RepID=A0ABQ9X5U4_9EUKA|nr:hypothetical protein BLNAU_17910 [Blattamonas nauphoetae]
MSATEQLHTLSTTGNQTIVNILIWIVTECVVLAYPRELMELTFTAAVDTFNSREVIFQKAVIPSFHIVTFQFSNRYCLNTDLFSLFLPLLDQILSFGPFHTPTLEYVLSSPIKLGFSRCLSYVGNWSSLSTIFTAVKAPFQYWKEDCVELT